MRLIATRTIQAVAVVFAVVVMVFVVTRIVGDPVLVMLGPDATHEDIAGLRAQLGLDRSIAAQFAQFVRDALVLDFGNSIWQRRPAIGIVFEVLPRTATLTVVALSIAVVLATVIGTLAAVKPSSFLDRALVSFSMMGLSIPQFWLGLMFIVVFSVTLGWLPTSGFGTPKHLILPATTLALPMLGRLSMLVRSTMIDELNRPWIKAQRARGLPTRRLIGVHALRNAAAPLVTLVGWELIVALAGASVIVEAVFAWPGIGFMLLESIRRNDLVLTQTIVLVVASLVVIINLLIDVLYTIIDPRIKLQ